MLDKDGIRRLIVEAGLDVVANTPLDGNVGHQPMHVFGVDARRVAGVGVAIRIAALAIEEVEELVAVLDRSHAAPALSSVLPLDFLPALRSASCW